MKLQLYFVLTSSTCCFCAILLNNTPRSMSVKVIGGLAVSSSYIDSVLKHMKSSINNIKIKIQYRVFKNYGIKTHVIYMYLIIFYNFWSLYILPRNYNNIYFYILECNSAGFTECNMSASKLSSVSAITGISETA